MTRALLLTVAIGGGLFLVGRALPSAEVWTSLTPGNCAEYCEGSLHCGALSARAAIQQPLNTWSNLAYIFFGVYALLTPAVGTIGLLFGSSMLVLGFGSLLFHATITLEFQWIDVAGMYFVLVALITVALQRLWPPRRSALIALAVVADLLLAAFKWQLNTWIAIPALGLGAAALLWKVANRDGASPKRLMIAAAILLVALMLQRLDVHRTVCWPDSRIFQGHALWHVMTAVALWLSYRAATGPASTSMS